jgi:hypothetical protein
MDRRSFLRTLATISAGAVLDPDRLLWVPGQRTFFIPAPRVNRNTLITPEWIMADVLTHWEQGIQFDMMRFKVQI